ncbi:hypothetical protein LBR03_21610 [Levilactobacillus brevis]|nr:hypothetical protein LBR03_21610 [Levilactobacillus brevis]
MKKNKSGASPYVLGVVIVLTFFPIISLPLFSFYQCLGFVGLILLLIALLRSLGILWPQNSDNK